MAWHDSNWNGCVCKDPEGNTYCAGTHSLLSSRIEKLKDVEKEQENAGEIISEKFGPDNVPPCYWSINAFSPNEFKVNHKHPFINKSVSEIVKPYSILTWPFRLSFVHTAENQKKHGNYWPDLEKRIENFTGKLKAEKSIVFFYANYDNPVSADDMKYLLIGCSVVKNISEPKHFPFSNEELNRYRKKDKKMKNLGSMHWGIQITHDPNKAVILPYKEYIEYAEKNPEDEEKLNEMRVTIDEESLVGGFKYVAMDIDDDKCLYLLYKLRKAIYKIREHNRMVVSSDLEEEERILDDMIKMTWEKRGLYPSLGDIISGFLEKDCSQLSERIQKTLSRKYTLLDFFEDAFSGNIPSPIDENDEHVIDIEELVSMRVFKKYYKSLLKLSLFNLTKNQLKNIIENKHGLLEPLADNPYVLYENYRHETKEEHMDCQDLIDEPIDIYKIDVGMIPDSKYVVRQRGVQNLSEDSPERIRSEIINYLWEIGGKGHCYDNLSYILKSIKENPLIYKTKVQLDEEGILNLEEDYKSHFLKKLEVFNEGNEKYFYLADIARAERTVKEKVEKLLQRDPHTSNVQMDVEKYINSCCNELQNIIPDFEETSFKKEREKLYKNIFKRSFYLLTGKPGSGKTYEISKIIKELHKLNEGLLVLTPTGKAALRLSENIKAEGNLDIKAQTIDRYIHENGFYWAYEDWERLKELPEKEKLTVGNLVIDESSMLDLQKLFILFSIIKFNEEYPKRIIFVGDENQLPPIGFGKPFYDIIQFVLSEKDLFEGNYSHLSANCRQKDDLNILRLAEAFSDKNRYYEESFELLEKEGSISEGLNIYYWRSKEELEKYIFENLEKLLDEELKKDREKLENTGVEEDPVKKFNLFLGLYDSGFVPKKNKDFKSKMDLERLQLITPYRTGFFGTVTLNKLIQKTYRKPSWKEKQETKKYFYHSDKIIRLTNYYSGRGRSKKIILSNGSIGVINRHPDGVKYYFRDAEFPLKWVDSEENFDLAYSITVHKSQGSDFNIVFLVIPNKWTLLSKELIYTALSRSKNKLFLLIYDAKKENLLKKSKGISDLLQRNTSLFEAPEDRRYKFYPRKGEKPVRSKVEYIIHQALQRSGLQFEYEAPLELEGLSFPIHPDFTITLDDGTTYYWEHLGLLDLRKYYNDWKRRKEHYKKNNLLEKVITTDDLDGIDDDKVEKVINKLRSKNLERTENPFSFYHFKLY